MTDTRYISFTFPGLKKVACIFGTRLGGISTGPFAQANISLDVEDNPERVVFNRISLKQDLGLYRWVELKQVHGTRVHFDLQDDFLQGAEKEGDGIGLSDPGAGAVIKTADCQPIFVAHISGRHILALHCGWRGNRAGFPLSGVRKFCFRYGLQPSDLMAVRGPSLGPCCSRFDFFDMHWPAELAAYYDPRKKTMDLWSLTRTQLAGAGIDPANIYSVDMCTRCREDLFFSYRREKRCGRQGNIIHISK